ncbi:hypothetical protein [Staphylococcus simiae]|uniref:Putative lipoprotein n=1 Tax=Staphylococcus simiae CCM 7213 = CCUG 51256 TaxID=911238 RepID=G5JI22_9STAP|nr:hypothetical protein [Staphylococcus simiae]EHJ08215.1 putative lipoprotein [Staphylococcus simiae CCM 7213 = CCUG 51256]PNZ14255.1 hypothetical protein CD113_02095 [Staphylococcus simiae]SNV82089.1 lipoprotein [Staphylococcus simiae]
MEKLNKAIMLLTSVGMVLSLTACNDKEGAAQQEHKQDKVAHQTTKQQKTSQDKQQTNDKDKQQASQDDVAQLPTKTKLALAFFADVQGEYTFTKDEALTGIYKRKLGGKTEPRQLDTLYVVKDDKVTGGPQGMDFYTVYPAKGEFQAYIGISNDKIFIAGTQGNFDYKSLQNHSKTYNLKEVYEKNKNYSSLPELAKEIELTNNNPIKDDNKRKEIEDKENPATMAHYRTQVYQMIQDLDGQPIDRDKYLVDNVRISKDGKWYVHYRNKNAEIVGTYTTEGNNIVKKDNNGKIIKSQLLNNKMDE